VVSADDISRAVAPGSMPFGQRQKFAGNLQSAMPGGSSQGPPSPPGLPQIVPQQSMGPLDVLTQGVHSSPEPVTAGLSVGPGRTPAPPGTAMLDQDRMNRLRDMAMNARTPALRNAARSLLRQMVREVL
jgi:hypothetical protein